MTFRCIATLLRESGSRFHGWPFGRLVQCGFPEGREKRQNLGSYLRIEDNFCFKMVKHVLSNGMGLTWPDTMSKSFGIPNNSTSHKVHQLEMRLLSTC